TRLHPGQQRSAFPSLHVLHAKGNLKLLLTVPERQMAFHSDIYWSIMAVFDSPLFRIVTFDKSYYRVHVERLDWLCAYIQNGGTRKRSELSAAGARMSTRGKTAFAKTSDWTLSARGSDARG